MSALPTPETIDLWRWDLDDPSWDRQVHLLDAREQGQASGFHNERLQNRYRRCRAVLRLILARYLAQPAGGIVFTYGPHGKPGLTSQDVHFNLSHSGQLALLAVSTRPVGVDIEATGRSDVAIDEVLNWICHPDEKRCLLSLRTVEREAAFYRLWTQKEAYCKALGKGLQKTLTTIRLERYAADSVLVLDAEAARQGEFFIHSLPAAAGYQASLCTPFSAPRLRATSIGPDGAQLSAAQSSICN